MPTIKGAINEFLLHMYINIRNTDDTPFAAVEGKALLEAMQCATEGIQKLKDDQGEIISPYKKDIGKKLQGQNMLEMLITEREEESVARG